MGFLRHDAVVGRPLASLEQNPAYGTALTFMYAIVLCIYLDADEQHRRVMQLAAGMKTEVPEDLLYVSTLGVRIHEAVEFALSACEEHQAVMVVLDSLGPAMVGDMAAAKDVIKFHNRYIAPFKYEGRLLGRRSIPEP
jgi:hypothetical protein